MPSGRERQQAVSREEGTRPTHLAREQPEQTPCEVERFKDRSVLVDPLLDKLVLEPAEELECELLGRGVSFVPFILGGER